MYICMTCTTHTRSPIFRLCQWTPRYFTLFTGKVHMAESLSVWSATTTLQVWGHWKPISAQKERSQRCLRSPWGRKVPRVEANMCICVRLWYICVYVRIYMDTCTYAWIDTRRTPWHRYAWTCIHVKHQALFCRLSARKISLFPLVKVYMATCTMFPAVFHQKIIFWNAWILAEHELFTFEFVRMPECSQDIPAGQSLFDCFPSMHLC